VLISTSVFCARATCSLISLEVALVFSRPSISGMFSRIVAYHECTVQHGSYVIHHVRLARCRLSGTIHREAYSMSCLSWHMSCAICHMQHAVYVMRTVHHALYAMCHMAFTAM